MLFFPATYQAALTMIAEDAIVMVKGRLDRREDAPKLVAMEVSAPELPAGRGGPFVVSITESAVRAAGGRPAPGSAAHPPRATSRCTCGC